jgi:hypothetical protein
VALQAAKSTQRSSHSKADERAGDGVRVVHFALLDYYGASVPNFRSKAIL